MAWHLVVLLVAAGLTALYLLTGFMVVLVGALIITKLKGQRIRPSYETMREANINMGGADFDAYDSMEKEAFVIHSHGADISCEFILAPEKPGSGPAKCFIRAHGFSVNKITGVRYIQILQKQGYSAVNYDQRSFGASGGVCSLGYYERLDLAAIIGWVRQHLGEDTIIGLHGESLGAITVVEALGIVPGIAFAIADSCSTTVDSIYKAVTHLPVFPFLSTASLLAKLKYGVDLRDVRPIDRAAQTDVPLLFLHGTKDKPIPYREAERLFAAAKNPLSRLELFEGVWHTGAHMMEPERYEKAVTEFVQAAQKAFVAKQREGALYEII